MLFLCALVNGEWWTASLLFVQVSVDDDSSLIAVGSAVGRSGVATIYEVLYTAISRGVPIFFLRRQS